MCGIAGIVGKYTKSEMHAMLKSQKHRGPDFTGTFFDDNIALGHNRLSIIDLSTESNQPFYNDSQRFALIFNGEIYNYIELRESLQKLYDFKTSGDTEVLLAAYIVWGKKCLDKLNGMFAFAIWDNLEQKLFAARDRFGIKPFHYWMDNERFMFSSEIKALHEAGIPQSPNQALWANYFVHGSYGMPNETFWENILRLPGGHYLEHDGENLKIEKWYDFEKAVAEVDCLDYADAKQKYRVLLHDAVSLRFRADVTVGINISGGLDSAILLGLVNDFSKGRGDVDAYTFYTGDANYDELDKVSSMVQNCNVDLHSVLFSADEVPNFANFIAKAQDEPFGGIPTLAYAKIFEAAAKNNTRVLLDGQGMDEQWAGYDYYADGSEALIQGVGSSPYRKNVLSDAFRALAVKPEYPMPFDNKLQNLQYRDLFYTKIPRALRFCDRISMAFSTELREPFLDYRLVEFAFAQSVDRKINKGFTKWMLRDIGKEYSSNQIVKSEKRALQTPQREWLGGELKEFVEECLDNIENGPQSDWFDIEVLRAEWQKYIDGDNQSSFHIWQWVNFATTFK